MMAKSGTVKSEPQSLDEVYCKTPELASLFGLSARRIQQLSQDNIIKMEATPDGKRYVLSHTVKAYITYLSDKASGREVKEAEQHLKEQKMRAEIALKESQAELHKLRSDIAAGRYISVEEVQLDYSQFFVLFKKFARGLASRVGSLINGYVEPVVTRKIERDISREIDSMLGGFVIAAEVKDRNE